MCGQCFQHIEATQHVPDLDNIITSRHEHTAWRIEQQIFDLMAVVQHFNALPDWWS